MKIKEMKALNNIEKEITKICPEVKWYGKLRGNKKGFVIYSKSEQQENLFTVVEIEKKEKVVIRQYPLGYDIVPQEYLKAVKQYFDEIQKVYGSDIIFNVDDENRVFLETRFEPIKELNWLIFTRFDIQNFLFSDSVNKLINGDLHRISDTVQYIREKEREAISELVEDIKNGELL